LLVGPLILLFALDDFLEVFEVELFLWVLLWLRRLADEHFDCFLVIDFDQVGLHMFLLTAVLLPALLSLFALLLFPFFLLLQLFLLELLELLLLECFVLGCVATLQLLVDVLLQLLDKYSLEPHVDVRFVLGIRLFADGYCVRATLGLNVEAEALGDLL
jgi:hypothetical protein